MFSDNLTKFLAVAIPVALALGNQVPSNIFLSIATVAAFFAYYVSTGGNAEVHESLKRTSIVAAFCVLALAPMVIFDNFYFFDDPEKSFVARTLKEIGEFTPYFVFFLSIGYAIFTVALAAHSFFTTTKQTKNGR